MSWSNELRVGLFVLIASALIGVGYVWFFDGDFKGEGTYSLSLTAPRADGLYEGTAVKLAGVDIGSVGAIAVEGGQARVELIIRREYELPVDTTAELRATGLLGDYFVSIDLGDDAALLDDGDLIAYGEEPGDIDAITRSVETITEDVAAITDVVRQIVEDRANRDNLEGTLENTEQFTDELRLIAMQNRRDIRDIVMAIERLTNNLDAVVTESGDDLDEEFDKVKDATDTLQSTLDNLESITGKVDRGEGSVGALINERDTVDNVNATVDDVNELVGGIADLQVRLYHWTRFYMGTNPTLDVDGSPLTPERALELFPPYGRNRSTWTTSHAIGVELMAAEDFWYELEFISHAVGRVTHDEYFIPSQYTGGDPSFYREYRVTQDYRWSFMIAKRWNDISLRLGVKENSGGVGFTWYVGGQKMGDKLVLMGDLFDFQYGAYPVVEDDAAWMFNTRIQMRYTPFRGMFLEAGVEQILPGIKYGYFTGYVGAGFYFTDNNLKLLGTALPL